MGRPKTPLAVGQADEALAYLQRAINRKADLFSVGLKETARSLVALRKRGLTLRQDDFAAETNAWLERHLTAEGRGTLLSALRQARAQSRRDEPLHNVRLPESVHADLTKLAEQLGLSLPATVAHLMAGARQG
jgi:hypothetical protein